jgi:hypothetical protein
MIMGVAWRADSAARRSRRSPKKASPAARRAPALFNERREGRVDLAIVAGVQDKDLQPEDAGGLLRLSRIGFAIRVARVHQRR